MLANFYSLEWKDSSTEFISRKPGEKKPTTTCKEYKRNPDGSVVYMVTKPNVYLLTLKKERLERLINAIDLAEKGETIMTAFDNTEFENMRANYEAEAKEKWGNTKAYKEYEQRAEKTDFKKSEEGLKIVFGKFAECKAEGNAPDSDDAQSLVKELQSFITNNFYTCTDEILKGLGVMYTADERFKENIDKQGSGTAEFISKAIEIYCKGLN